MLNALAPGMSGLGRAAAARADVVMFAVANDRPAPVFGAGSEREASRGSDVAPNGRCAATNFAAASVEGRRLGVEDMRTC